VLQIQYSADGWSEATPLAPCASAGQQYDNLPVLFSCVVRAEQLIMKERKGILVVQDVWSASRTLINYKRYNLTGVLSARLSCEYYTTLTYLNFYFVRVQIKEINLTEVSFSFKRLTDLSPVPVNSGRTARSDSIRF
jgi:hypothetical protein